MNRAIIRMALVMLLLPSSALCTTGPLLAQTAQAAGGAALPGPAPAKSAPPILSPGDRLLLAPDREPDDGAQIFDQNAILLRPPELKALVSVSQDLNPFGLDASFSQPVDLRHVLKTALDNNLDIAINRTSTDASRWQLYSALGKFAPDLVLGYQEFWARGNVGLPFNFRDFGRLAGLPTVAGGGGGSNSSTLSIRNPFVLMRAGFNYNIFRGGRILYSALQSRHVWRAARSGLQATLSDVLLNTTKGYYNLVLSEALLQIRIKAVQTSQEQVKVNTDRFETGLGTNLDVLQAKTQLSRDRQNLIDQQVARRTTAIQLADIININLGTDLMPLDMSVRKRRLIGQSVKIADLLKLAIDNRPELKQYEELRLAAKRAINVAVGPLLPTFSFGGTIFGIGPGLSKAEALYTMNVNLRWDVSGLGTTDYANVRVAKLQARQAQLQAQKELVTILDQVRTSFLQSLDADRKIDETSNEVASSLEELRLAQLRHEHGLGTNLDIVTGQRDYTQALISKAQAIINFNIAQAQLVHDLGLMSVDNLTSGRMIGDSLAP